MTTKKELLIKLYHDLRLIDDTLFYGVGNSDAKILIIAETNCYNETKTFSDILRKKTLDRLVGMSTMDATEIFCTYYIKSRNNLIDNISVLRNEINILQPIAMISLGSVVTKFLLDIKTKKVDMKKLVGNNYNNIFPSYDIEFCVRNKKYFDTTIGVFKNVKEFITSTNRV